MEKNNIWMNDPELKNIDKSKLIFLENLFFKTNEIKNDKKELMNFLLSLSKLSKDNNIKFQKEEIELIFSVLKKYSSDEDISKMQQMSKYFRFLH